MATLDDEFNSYLTLDDEFSSYPEINKETVPVKKPAPVAPKPAPEQETTFGDALGKSFTNVLGLGPRVLAARDATNAVLGDPTKGPKNEPVPGLADRALNLAVTYFQNRDGARDKFKNTYDSALKTRQHEYAKAAEDQPVATVFGGLGQGIALGGAGIISGVKSAAGVGAATGFLGSGKDLGSEDSLWDAARGGGLGAAGFKVPIPAGLATAAYGAYTGDNVSLLSGLLGAGAGTVGRAQKKASNIRAAAEEAALEKPRLAIEREQVRADKAGEQVRGLTVKKAEQLERKIVKDAQRAEREGNRSYGRERDALLAQEEARAKAVQNLESQKQAVLQKLVDAANEEYQGKVAEIVKTRATTAKAAQAQNKALDKLSAERQSLLQQLVDESNSEYQKQLAKLVKPTSKSRPSAEAKLEMMGVDLDSAEARLPSRIEGTFAAESGGQINRVANMKALGIPIPEEFQPRVNAAIDSYGENSPRILARDPQAIAQEFGNIEKTNISRKRDILKSKLEKLSNPDAQAADPFADPKLKESAYALAKEIGLNPGDLSSFDPRGKFTLADGNAPPPSGSKLEVLRKRMSELPAEPATTPPPIDLFSDPAVVEAARKAALESGLNPGDTGTFNPKAPLPMAMKDAPAPSQATSRAESLRKQYEALLAEDPTAVKSPDAGPKLTPEVRKRLYAAAKKNGLNLEGVNPESFDPYATYGVLPPSPGATDATNPGKGQFVAPASGPAEWQAGQTINQSAASPIDQKINAAQGKEQSALMKLQAAKDLIADPKAYVRSKGVPELKKGAIKGAIFGAGAGAGIGLLGGGGLSVGGAGLGALGGLLLSASRNPAARAVLSGAVEKALVVNPAMAAKYGGFLGGKRADFGNAIYALSKDPEFRDSVESILRAMQASPQ